MSVIRALPIIVVLFVAVSSGVSPSAQWHLDGPVAQSGNGQTWGTAFKTIQEGINAASDGDTVVVATAVYVENISFRGKNIVVRSMNPADRAVVEKTIIDGSKGGPVVSFYGTEAETCVLSGFTLQRGGYGERGAGVSGGWDRSARATIENNIIRDNWGAGIAFCDGTIQNNTISRNPGGGLYWCNGVIRANTISANSASYGGGVGECNAVIENNTISGNSASVSGGGLYACIGSFKSNTISGNSAGERGGGAYACIGTFENNIISQNAANVTAGKTVGGGGLADCDGTLRNNTIVGNVAINGGGLWECGGTIESNLICGNSSRTGYGGGLAYCAGRIRNNIISANSADHGDGGGLYDCDATLENNNICYNKAAWRGGALYGCQAVIRNCIIWGNEALYPGHAQLELCDQPTYSCIEDWTGGGEGNIAADPQFVDPDGPDKKPTTYLDNDYRLLPSSPCIDRGYNAPELPDTDIAGLHRIMYGGKSFTVDMGAYEYFIYVLASGPGAEEKTLTWSSVAGKSYSIFYTEDLVTWRLADDAVLSAGNETTSWIDDGSKTGGVPPALVARRFYRILENP